MNTTNSIIMKALNSNSLELVGRSKWKSHGLMRMPPCYEHSPGWFVSVYFLAVEHTGIRDYVHRIAETLKITGQLAFDFVETESENKDKALDHEIKLIRDRGSSGSITVAQEDAGSNSSTRFQQRLITIECNPRATSGIHLWSRSPLLASILTSASALHTCPRPMQSTMLNPLFRSRYSLRNPTQAVKWDREC